jgi:hypothetical protein
MSLARFLCGQPNFLTCLRWELLEGPAYYLLFVFIRVHSWLRIRHSLCEDEGLMTSIPELIGQWREKRISGNLLMRGLVSYNAWQIRVSEQSAIEAMATNSFPSLTLFIRDGKKCLLAFSSGEAYDAYAKAMAVTESQHLLTLPGLSLIDILQEVDVFCVDPYSPQDIFYEKDLFGRLKDMANAIRVEQAITALRQGTATAESFRLARDYKNYYLPTVVRDGKPVFLMAPDGKGRKLAAAFTSDDTFDAYLAECQGMAGDAKVQQLQTDGGALFDAFLWMKVDGFVFNCSGPITPVAFAQAAADVILKGYPQS